MRKFLPLLAALCSGLLTALAAAPLLSARTLVAILFAALTGALIAYFLVGRRGQTNPFPLVANLNAAGDGDDPGGIAALGRLFEATMSGMREGVLVIDHEMRVVASNEVARGLFAYAAGRADSRYLIELTQNQSIRSAFADALGGEEVAEIKVEGYGPERRVFDLRVMPLRPGGVKRARGAVGIFFDVTSLERLERVRQEFLSNVSHELRTPLAAIIAFAETLEDGAADDEENRCRFLSIIRKNAARMHALIDDILELGAIEAGDVRLKPAAVPLRQIVADVYAAVAPKAEARRLSLLNEVGEGVTVWADRRRLEQMLTNLVDNAVKFNREGGSVAIRHEPNGADSILVADTGEGIPPEHLARLFERFYRVDKARSREMGGTGLGLAIVKHLARAHGGEVTVRSKPGQGSTFVIQLPKTRVVS